MRKIRKELESLRYEIQREKATLRALQRESRRMHGKEVIHYGSTSAEGDAARIIQECGVVPSSPASMQDFIADQKRILAEMQRRRDEIEEGLVSRFPLTPCALYKLLTYDNGVKRKKRKRKRTRQR